MTSIITKKKNVISNTHILCNQESPKTKYLVIILFCHGYSNSPQELQTTIFFLHEFEREKGKDTWKSLEGEREGGSDVMVL